LPPSGSSASASLGTSTTSLAGYIGGGSIQIPPSTATNYQFLSSGGNTSSSVSSFVLLEAAIAHTYVVNPTLTTQASAAVIVGGPVSDAATLAGGTAPTGTLTFRLYGPDDPGCSSAPVFTSSPVAVNGNGTYGSGNFTTAQAGTFLWRASYSGDANNAAVTGACGAPNEAVVVDKASPTLGTVATPAHSVLGGSVSDTATLAGGVNPTGTIAFRLYGPDDPTCAGAPAFTSAAIAVNGNGAYSSGAVIPPGVGTYSFVAEYSGDANNNPATHGCNLLSETVSISAGVPALGPLELLLLVLGLAVAGGVAAARRGGAHG
jgi:hypothetical protein